MRQVWLDVGAHRGGRVREIAEANASVLVYAFEPNLRLAAAHVERGLPNYVVVAAAVAEVDGVAPFHIADADTGSSLLGISRENAELWVGGALSVVDVVPVPTVRLDTFLDATGVREGDALYIDAQGADLGVLRSAGRRIADVRRIRVEVAVTLYPVYKGAATKDEILAYLEARGFALVEVDSSSHGQEEYLSFDRIG